MSCFFSSVSPDAWIQTIGTILGAFIGTFLAGYFAVKLSKREKEEAITKRYLNSMGSLNYLIEHFQDYFEDIEPKIISMRIKTSELKRADYLNEINKGEVPLSLRKNFKAINDSLSQLFHYQVINEVIHKMSSTDSNLEEMEKFYKLLLENKKIVEEKLKVVKYI